MSSLNKFSYFIFLKKKIKPQSGFEPETSCLQGKRSNQLSYNGSYYLNNIIENKIFYD